jgi:predicted ATPase
MKKIVLTGAPCSGKTTLLNALKQHYQDKVAVMPEMATLLLGQIFPPLPQKKDEWVYHFQHNVLNAQILFEQSVEEWASIAGASFILCDRGTLDGACYLDGGIDAFCEAYHVNLSNHYGRYDLVLQLEGLANANPDQYMQELRSNPHRLESGVEESQKLHKAIQDIWSPHSQYHYIPYCLSVEERKNQMIQLMDQYL